MTEVKAFPGNYSERVLDIIKNLSMSGLKNVEVLGSFSIKSQLYAGDIDTQNNVIMQSIEAIASELKTIVKRLPYDAVIKEIKCGEIHEWDPFRADAILEDKKIHNFSIKESQSIIDAIPATAISPEERKRAIILLEKATTPFGFLEAKKLIRFHILRWNCSQILDGTLLYRGLRITLEDALKTKGMIKIDLIANIERFTEFSMIYNIKIKGKLITPIKPNLILSLSEDIAYYNNINPFKALKRIFSLAKATGNKKAVAELIPILNSDLGRLYQIIGDLEILKEVADKRIPQITEIRAQLDEIRSRIGNIYELQDFLKKEHDIIGDIYATLRIVSPVDFKGKLTRLISTLSGILNTATGKIVGIVGK